MLKTAGVDNMEDFYKLHPTEEHFFKTYPHMKDKMKKRKTVRRRKYQPGGGVPFTDFAAAQAQGDQYAVDQANREAAQQYLYKHPVYPTLTGAAPVASLPEVTITAPQQPFYYKSPKEVYQEYYQNVAPYYPMRSLAEYQQAYATTGMPPAYGDTYDADKRLHDVRTGRDNSAEGLYNAYQNYLNTVAFNHRHQDNGTAYDVYKAGEVFNTNLLPYVGNTGDKRDSTVDWDKVQQGLDTKNYNVDARTRSSFRDHDNGVRNKFYESNWDYRDALERIAPKEFGNVPGVPPSLLGPEYYQKGGTAGEGSQEMLQKIMQLAAQAFQQGHDPRQVLKVLIKQGIPEETAMQIIQAVIRQDEDSDESQEGMQEGAQQEYAKGGIHINPAKKGTFTAQATRMGMGVQEAARHILANKDRYSPGMVKKANFARNASKWKHKDGGPAMNKYGYGTGEDGVNPLPVNPMAPSPQERNRMLMDQYMADLNVNRGPVYDPNNAGPRNNRIPNPPNQQWNAGPMEDPNRTRPLRTEMVPYNIIDPATGRPMPINPMSPRFRRGGYYQEGGETMGQEQMEGAPQQAQEQAMGQEQQGGQEQMMQQLAQMVAQGLQQGMDPQQIIQMLVQQGVPQEVATQVVQMVMQQMGGGAQGGPGQQYQPQGGQYQGPQPQAAMGGYYANGGSFFNESYMPFDY